MKLILTAVTLITMTISVAAQWVNHPTPGIPRTADGRPNLTAAAPHAVVVRGETSHGRGNAG